MKNKDKLLGTALIILGLSGILMCLGLCFGSTLVTTSKYSFGNIFITGFVIGIFFMLSGYLACAGIVAFRR